MAGCPAKLRSVCHIRLTQLGFVRSTHCLPFYPASGHREQSVNRFLSPELLPAIAAPKSVSPSLTINPDCGPIWQPIAISGLLRSCPIEPIIPVRDPADRPVLLHETRST